MSSKAETPKFSPEEIADFRAKLSPELLRDFDALPEHLKPIGMSLEATDLMTKTRFMSIAAIICMIEAKEKIQYGERKDLAEALFGSIWSCAVTNTCEILLKFLQDEGAEGLPELISMMILGGYEHKDKFGSRLKNLMELIRPVSQGEHP